MEALRLKHSCRAYFPLGLQISRRAWIQHGLSELEAPTFEPGDEAGLNALRRLVDRLGASPVIGSGTLSAGYLLCISMFQEACRHLIDTYCVEQTPGALTQGLEWVRKRGIGTYQGDEAVARPLLAFVKHFPPLNLFLESRLMRDLPEGRSEMRPARQFIAREMVLLALAAENPALEPARSAFDDDELRALAPFGSFIGCLDEYFEGQPLVADLGQSLFECLRAPVRAAPDSVEGQLAFALEHWGAVLPEQFKRLALMAEDILKEETKLRLAGPGPAEVLEFAPPEGEHGYPEPERFSEDVDWMSNVVLIAKTVYVWLDQLSKQYGRTIRRLDQIPNEELDRLARWGFTGLWLIGVWERSPASSRIKQMRGNPEAASSAYSIYDYTVAQDLGGPEALRDLSKRALGRGIRLGSDMVPNHMGVYSKWVVEHPDWFVQLEHPPFPGYSFNGPDLSQDSRVSVFIEDGYWDERDAAVIFKRVDNFTGDVRYIYHGNDGTSMPWNDTAQLNYLLPEVREAVIQTVLHVARQFPILRFDAAMTLTKRHYQRLWFPPPGEGGAIPSRAEHGMTRAQFNEAMPEEFWRQVVDRVTADAPDTLLLAEAFWLMEGFFVRTLGMHRVYNSAFMNMLKMEDNAKYRTTVKNVLEFSPEVLKRFVNFASNPDELTAIEQFGKEDKYFGAAMLMATMPGLPMFGHGQIEGFTEKYGMEYRRAYWNEQVDEDLVRRHEREIFPLMRKRYLFSEVRHFAFYDFITPEGYVDENVFAYSNRAGGERALILYNNAYTTTSGRIRTSTTINTGSNGDTCLTHRTLAEALGIRTEENFYYVFRDRRDGLEYVREGRDLAENGLFVALHAYQYHAFLDFREVQDQDDTWRQLVVHLRGDGVPNVDEARRALVLEPALQAFRKTLNVDVVRQLANPTRTGTIRARSWRGFEEAMETFVGVLADTTSLSPDAQSVLESSKALCSALVALAGGDVPQLTAPLKMYFAGDAPRQIEERIQFWRIAWAWSILQPLESVLRQDGEQPHGASWIDQWLLSPVIEDLFKKLKREDWLARLDTELLKILFRFGTRSPEEEASLTRWPLPVLFEDPLVRDFLFVNEFEGTLWLNKEQLGALLHSLFVIAFLSVESDAKCSEHIRSERPQQWHAEVQMIITTAEKAGYQYQKFLELLAD